MRTLILSFATLALLAGCAQVPKESVQLSATVGRDVAEIERSHRALVRIHYDGLERSINRFVDEVYAPYQIGETLKNPAVGGKLVQAIQEGAQPVSDDKTRTVAFDAIGYYFVAVRGNIEKYRSELLQPVRAQRDRVLQQLDVAYRQVQNGNSIVTGYLASVAKITEEQNKLLAQVGLPNLQAEIGTEADKLSQELGTVNMQVRTGELKLTNAVEQGNTLIENSSGRSRPLTDIRRTK
jgi:prophage DNA circulation protein